MDRREYVVILSDIHIGTLAPTVWYRREIHEKYLVAILNQIIANASQIREVILLGDIFEFWTYSPYEFLPSIDDIIAVHPNILGPKGKLCQMLSALKGNVVFIPGEHDMNVTREDLNKIKSAEGYTIKYVPSVYIPNYDKKIVFTHGHEFTLLNAPYYKSRLAPLPIGHFIYRAIAFMVQNILEKKHKDSIASLEGFGVYSMEDFFTNLPQFLNIYEKTPYFTSKLMDEVADITGISKDLPIQVNKNTSISLNEVKKIYQDIYLSWDEKKNTFHGFDDVVIMGHTHYPMTVNKNGYLHCANTGFMCPSDKKIQNAQLTYGIYNLISRNIKLVRVTENNPANIMACENLPKENKVFYSIADPTYSESAIDLYKSEQNLAPFVFGWSVYNASWEYYMIMQFGVLSKAEELGIEVIKQDQESNGEKMIADCLELISKGVNALLVSPYYPEGVPIIAESAQKNNIPVVVIDGGTGGANVAAFIISDSFAGGIFAGEYALTLINKYDIKSKNVAIIKAEATAKYALLRGKGFADVLLEKSYQIVAEVSANGVLTQAYEAMRNILLSYADDLAVVFCENGLMTVGAARAIDEAGKKGKIMLIGFDADPSVLAGIENGSIQGTIAQQPYKMGQIGVEVANAVLHGKPVAYDNATEKIILMEVFLIDENGEIKPNIV